MTPSRNRRLRGLVRQIQRLDRRINHLDRISRKYSMTRLGIVIAGLLSIAFINYLVHETGGWITAALFVLVFLIVARRHARVDAGLKRHRVWQQIKTTHMARMTLSWPKIPGSDVASPGADHPFDADLNLTGDRSLHQLLNISTSQGGSNRLRDWLLDPVPDPACIHERQALVRELMPMSTFRDKLTLYGLRVLEDRDARWDGDTVCRWLERHAPTISLRPYVALLSLLAVTNITLYILYSLILIPSWWWISFSAYVLIYLCLYSFKRSALDRLEVDASHLETVLTPFRSILLYIESYRLAGKPHLAALCKPFHIAGRRPSAHLKQITFIAGGAKWQKGQFLWLILNALAPWDLYFTYRLSRFREQLRTHLPVWLDTWYELEAYNALANFGHLNPDTTFPEVASSVEGHSPVFRAQGVGHPFLSEKSRISNDFTIDHVHDLAIITGSNMSGKSTFLRTLGLNLRLAYAGGTVFASSFYTIPFRLFTSMKVTDSVTDGVSYFYAEVRRLKALLQALEEGHPWPLFFMIDEIFRGTNNRERLIGSRAYIRSLVEKHGVGIISTHDLELVHLEEEISGIANYHFREEVHNGVMIFDFHLRPGPCPTTNALKIMQLEGLPVEQSISKG